MGHPVERQIGQHFGKVKSWKKRARKMNDENNGYLLYVDTSRARAKIRSWNPELSYTWVESD